MIHRRLGLVVVVIVLTAKLLPAQQPQGMEFNDTQGSPTLQYEPVAAWWATFAGAEATYLAFDMPKLHGFEFNYGMEAAPRIWVGLQNPNGWGAQVRYWQFDAESQYSGPFPGFDDRIIRNTRNAELYTIDAEVFRRWDAGAWNNMLTFGGRQAGFQESSQGAAVLISGPFKGDLLEGLLVHDFNGGGLTTSFQTAYQLGFSGLQVVWNGRASFLWGQETRYDDATRYFSGGVFHALNKYREDSQLTILETQVGLQWRHPLACCRGVMFARTMFEYQNWNTSSLFHLVNDVGTIPFHTYLDANFYGVAFAIGLQI